MASLERSIQRRELKVNTYLSKYDKIGMKWIKGRSFPRREMDARGRKRGDGGYSAVCALCPGWPPSGKKGLGQRFDLPQKGQRETAAGEPTKQILFVCALGKRDFQGRFGFQERLEIQVRRLRPLEGIQLAPDERDRLGRGAGNDLGDDFGYPYQACVQRQIRQKLLRLGIECRERELVRGALLHDYFLYDWHVKDKTHRLHGFFHPGTALANAQKEYVLSKREKNIILRHMWPLTPCPPACREAWIVTAADKYCSLRETLFLRRRRDA